MGDLSPHFSRKEFACRCCGRLQLDPRLLEALEALRRLAGTPVIIHAGYRCPGHNLEVGGVPNSEKRPTRAPGKPRFFNQTHGRLVHRVADRPILTLKK
jgi:hypothetical protein